MLDVTTAAWAATIGLVLALLALDLAVSGRRDGAVGFRAAAWWSAFYVGVAIAFGVAFGVIAGWDYGAQYFAGYIVEKSLSVDNLFVFVIIMSTFAVAAVDQPKVLTFGILVALVLRAIFIALGAALLATFSFTFVLFGLMLVVTGVQLFRHRDQDPSVEDNVVVRLARRVLPADKPLLLPFIAIATTDVVFALDSIPAVFGVTEEAYIVFAANAFALLGLRALYFLVSGLLDRLVYLSIGLSAILVFIGAKLMLHYAHKQDPAIPEISIGLSLAVITGVLAVTTVASIVKTRRDPQARAHAGSLRAHPRSEDQLDAGGTPHAHRKIV